MCVILGWSDSDYYMAFISDLSNFYLTLDLTIVMCCYGYVQLAKIILVRITGFYIMSAYFGSIELSNKIKLMVMVIVLIY